jgi:hypothetical protein
MFLHRRWLQKLSIKVQVLNANLVAMCMLYGDAYHTRSATRNAGTSVQRAVVVRQMQMGSHPRPVADCLALIKRYPHYLTNLRLYDSCKE